MLDILNSSLSTLNDKRQDPYLSSLFHPQQSKTNPPYMFCSSKASKATKNTYKTIQNHMQNHTKHIQNHSKSHTLPEKHAEKKQHHPTRALLKRGTTPLVSASGIASMSLQTTGRSKAMALGASLSGGKKTGKKVEKKPRPSMFCNKTLGYFPFLQ